MSRLTNAAAAACLAFAIAACGGEGDSPAAPDNGGGNPTCRRHREHLGSERREGRAGGYHGVARPGGVRDGDA
jgi:hypothetical protein